MSDQTVSSTPLQPGWGKGKPAAFSIDGGRKVRGDLTSSRVMLTSLFFILVFAIIGARLVSLGAAAGAHQVREGHARNEVTASRPDLLDRNGEVLATDIAVPSVVADPRRIVDLDEAVEKLSEVMPDMDRDWLRKRLSKKSDFAWIRREVSPALKAEILQLGLPGISFLNESKRFYPGHETASHILGHVNKDNQGKGGVEFHLDKDHLALLQSLGLARGREMEPVRLSIDLRVQHVLASQLKDAVSRYSAIAAAGVIVDVMTGEVIGMASVPDYDPNDPKSSLSKDAFNRITAGTYELGSTFKTLTLAAALDSGRVRITDRFDARQPIILGRNRIRDFHGQNRILTVPEVFKHSSNIGTVKIMQKLGKDNYLAFLQKIGMAEVPAIELPEKKAPYLPKEWKELTAMTASFGHGLTVSPLQLVSAIGALVNGGNYLPATIFPRTAAEASTLSHRVVSVQTSDYVRYLLRLNSREGTARKSNIKGYRIGGKTGTAEKVIDGRYSSKKNLSVFASAFPMDAPRYAMVVLVDEPQKEEGTPGHTAGWNAVPTTARIVARIAPMLGVMPNFDPSLDAHLRPAGI